MDRFAIHTNSLEMFPACWGPSFMILRCYWAPKDEGLLPTFAISIHSCKAAIKRLQNIKEDCYVHWKHVQGCILYPPSWRLVPEEREDQVSCWLWGWWHAQSFGLRDLRSPLRYHSVLTSGGTQLTTSGMNILGSKLAGLINRVLT